ncbi:MAG: putative PEP-binding protein [Chloroflexota bacterium]
MTVPEPGEKQHQGVGAADGISVGPAHLLVEVTVPAGGTGGPEEQARAAQALQAVAAQLGQASARLRRDGRHNEAEILDASQLMAEDPSLLDEVTVLAATRPAATALLEATNRQADALAAIPDAYLAARAADVRRLGRQAARLVGMDAGDPLSPGRGQGEVEPVIIVARDLGPADFAEIEVGGIGIGGIALAEGSGTSHAGIMARALGVPLVVGLGDAVLSIEDGTLLVLDGSAGSLAVYPAAATLASAQARIAQQQAHRTRLTRSRAAGAVTSDGHAVQLLVNASTEREALAGLEAGAVGIGLLRTELAFLDAASWPSDAQHEAAVRPILRHLAGRVATVRTLDFGADKTPPFLAGRSERGIALQLSAEDALAAQLRGILRARGEARVRIMLPLIESAGQLAASRALLMSAQQATTPNETPPSLGAMIETQTAVQQIDALAKAADFLSIGTNDLAGDVLGVNRLSPAATVRAAADPRVLQAIRQVTAAASRHGRTVEVCGEAAGDPRLALLLIGLGVSELSVSPSHLDEVRAAIQSASMPQMRALAANALTLDSAEAVLASLPSTQTHTLSQSKAPSHG